MQNKIAFTKNMIAPCGLDCSICQDALRKENPCGGCLGPVEQKSKHCIENCTIFSCKHRTSQLFCSDQPCFPCDALLALENRYATFYPNVESPLGNIQFINQFGTTRFLKEQQQRWTCKNCGGIICVHSGICSECGMYYTDV